MEFGTLFRYFIIFVIIIFNISLVPSQGIGNDMSILAGFNKRLVQYSNPLYGHTKTENAYPPLSTVIYSFFTHLYENIIGFNEAYKIYSPEYALPIKISTATFYILFLILMIGFKSLIKRSKFYSKLDILIICLTTFSLSLQSNSLAFTDILTAPAIIVSIIYLFKKKYFLGGLILGVAMTIKWQPVVLVPIFVLTVVNLRGRFLESLLSSLRLVFGIVLIPIIIWSLVLSYPEGNAAFNRGVVNFLMSGAPYFSGLALNINWITGYFLHLTQPGSFESLSSNNGLNTLFGSYMAPEIFQGYFFYLVAAMILLKYWFSYKKDLPNFLTVATLVYFSHYMLNKGVYSNHSFYFVLMMLMLYIAKPTLNNRIILILFDIMNFINQFLFYGLLGPSNVNRIFLGIDITVIFAVYYFFVYGIVLRNYFKYERLFPNKNN